MEIIRRGTIPQEKQFEDECTYCKSVIRFKAGEARHSTHMNESYWTVTCPVCSHPISAQEYDMVKS